MGKKVLVPFRGHCRSRSSMTYHPDSLFTIVSLGSYSTSLKVLALQSTVQIGSKFLLLSFSLNISIITKSVLSA